MRSFASLVRVSMVAMTVLALTSIGMDAWAVTSRVRFETANYALNKGDGLKTYNNENAALGTNEAYILSAYVVMYRATGDRIYLDRLVDHADSVLKSRDDVLGVTEYNGASSACWRNTNLQPAKQPYCYLFHSAMITWPLAEFAVDVYADGSLWTLTTPGGATYKQKADEYIQKVKETIAFHEPTWKDGPNAGEGHYIHEADATFLSVAGKEVRLAHEAAMGRTLLAMSSVTGDAAYAAKAAALAKRVKGQLAVQVNGSYAWNGLGGTYKAPGDDISNGAVVADFAYLAFKAQVGFDATDMTRFADTFFRNIYKDSATLYDNVGGGGAANTAGYVEQVGRWVQFSGLNASIYAIVRDLYDSFDATKTNHGSQILGYAYLALHEPIATTHTFYPQDWKDNVSYKTATAQGSNLLVKPAAPSTNAIILVTYRSTVPVSVQQYSNKYNDILFWTATAGQWKARWMPFRPDLWVPFGQNAEALYQFTENPFTGIEVANPKSIQQAAITTAALPAAQINQPWSAQFEGIGEQPFEWKLLSAPAGMTIDWATGKVSWAKASSTPGSVSLKIRLSTDYGYTDVLFTLDVAAPDGTPCDDGDSCTESDIYTAGVCKGKPLDCTGLDTQCTSGSCQNGACVAIPKDGACNDGDPCTVTDVCANGTCAGVGLDCSNLDDTCVVGVCEAGLCVAAPIEAVCDDSDSCTTDDKCVAGSCQGTPMDCSQLNAGCFAGVCVDGVCQPAPVEGPCNDGDPCTDNDVCVDGQCQGSPKDCSEFVAGPCVKPACIQGVCYGKPILGPCDDGDPCTEGEICQDGLCAGGEPKDCSGIVGTCITGECQEGECVPVPTTGPCDDGDPCTIEDSCSQNGCAGAPKKCPSGTWCVLGECTDIPVEEEPDVVEQSEEIVSPVDVGEEVAQPDVVLPPDGAGEDWTPGDEIANETTVIPDVQQHDTVTPDLGGDEVAGGEISDDAEDGDITLQPGKKKGDGCSASATPSAGPALLLFLALALVAVRRRPLRAHQ